MKRIIALLLAALMVVSICACGSDSNNTPATEKQTEAVTAAPDNQGNGEVASEAESAAEETTEAAASYWPDEFLKDRIVVSCSSDVNGFTIGGKRTTGQAMVQIYEKLLQPDAYGKAYYNMLKTAKQVDDLTWDLEIWDCIYDTAGNNITAEDVKFGFQYLVDGGKSAAVSNFVISDDGEIGIDVTGDYTCTIHLHTPFGPGEFNTQLTNPDIVSKKAYDASGSDEMVTKPVGTGPYMLKELVVGSKVVLEANPNYWMKNITDEEWLAENFYCLYAQNVREIELDIIKDGTTRAMALENEDICAMDSANAQDVRIYENSPGSGITPVYAKEDTPIFFYFNCSDSSLCSNADFRKAICYAIDNEGVAGGLSLPANACKSIFPGSLDAPESWSDPSRDYYDFDLAKAKEYLDKAGYKGEEITCVVETGGQQEEAMILIQSQLRTAGINLNLVTTDTTTLIDYRSSRMNEWDMMVETFTGGGGYLGSSLRKFWSVESADTHDGNQIMGILDTKLDDLFVALKADTNEQTVKAWDDYFTYDKCYAYAICACMKMTAVRDWVNCVLGGDKDDKIVPGAFTFND